MKTLIELSEIVLILLKVSAVFEINFVYHCFKSFWRQKPQGKCAPIISVPDTDVQSALNRHKLEY